MPGKSATKKSIEGWNALVDGPARVCLRKVWGS